MSTTEHPPPFQVVRAADLKPYTGQPLPPFLSPTAVASTAKANSIPTLFLSGRISPSSPTTPQTWQDELITHLRALSLPMIIFNPLRPDWDSTWPTDDAEHPALKQQVNWELDALKVADVNVVFFGGGGKAGGDSPVTLMEFGWVMGRKGNGNGNGNGGVVVWCQRDYSKRVNVEILCGREGVKVVWGVEECVEEVRRRVAEFGK